MKLLLKIYLLFMRKNKIFYLLFISLFFLFPLTTVMAVSTTPSPTITPKITTTTTPTEAAGLDDKIKELKDKLASRVAELNVVSQKVLTGEIKTLSDEKIILTVNDAEINVEINEDTKFYELGRDNKKSDLELDDLKTGEQVVVWGSFNSSTNTITTNNVYRQPNDISFVGKVKGVDRKNFQVTVTDTENTDYTVDVEVDTKVNQYDASKGLVKAGFSKIKEEQFLYVLAEPPTNEKNLVSGKNIVVLFDPTNITTPTPTETEK